MFGLHSKLRNKTIEDIFENINYSIEATVEKFCSKQVKEQKINKKRNFQLNREGKLKTRPHKNKELWTERYSKKSGSISDNIIKKILGTSLSRIDAWSYSEIVP